MTPRGGLLRWQRDCVLSSRLPQIPNKRTDPAANRSKSWRDSASQGPGPGSESFCEVRFNRAKLAKGCNKYS